MNEGVKLEYHLESIRQMEGHCVASAMASHAQPQFPATKKALASDSFHFFRVFVSWWLSPNSPAISPTMWKAASGRPI